MNDISLIWDMIKGSGTFNGHYQMSLNRVGFDTLKDVVKELEEFLEHDGLIEIRLVSESTGRWGASVYLTDVWSKGEHPNDHLDQLILSVDYVVFD